MIKDNLPETVLFDMDGTLIDQFRAIWKCYNYVEGLYGRPLSSLEEIKTAVGGALRAHLDELFGPELGAKAEKDFKEYYNDKVKHELEILPGAEWIIENLHQNGHKLAIFTNKPNVYAVDICQKLGIDKYFQEIIGEYDTPHLKPEPEYSHYALKKMGAKPHTAALIGDSHYDVDAGANVGMPVYIVTTGSHTAERIEAHPNDPHGVYESLYHLGEDVFKLEPELILS